jgi:glucosamine-6-phosphate deaminase
MPSIIATRASPRAASVAAAGLSNRARRGRDARTEGVALAQEGGELGGGRPRVKVRRSGEAAARSAAARVIDLLRARPDAVLGLATGGTMEPVYAMLVAAHRDGLSFARATTFNLDEYLGLPPGHPARYAATMRAQLFDHVDLPAARAHLPRVDLGAQAAARDYEERLARAGPVDLQLLGIGRNGHIGFNEPGSPFGSRTWVVDLAPSTIEANRRFFPGGEAPPTRAVSMGIATILSARAIVMLATGEAKADAVRAALEGPVGLMVPATALRGHGDATLVLDPGAASGLTKG